MNFDLRTTIAMQYKIAKDNKDSVNMKGYAEIYRVAFGLENLINAMIELDNIIKGWNL